MNAITEHLITLWQQALGIWVSGGWCMPPIAITALVMFALGMNTYIRLRETGFRSVPEKTWRRWIETSPERKGTIGELLDFVVGGNSIKDISVRFEELRITAVAPFERDLRVMKICVTVSPLLGLLGTVTGMLTTFSALASGSGGEKTMAMVSAGISEALITTETGLVVALPGLFIHYILLRNLERYKSFLAHVESVCTQQLYRKQQKAAMPCTRILEYISQTDAVCSSQQDRALAVSL